MYNISWEIKPTELATNKSFNIVEQCAIKNEKKLEKL